MSFFIADVIIFVLKNIVLIGSSSLRIAYDYYTLFNVKKQGFLRIEEAIEFRFWFSKNDKGGDKLRPHITNYNYWRDY